MAVKGAGGRKETCSMHPENPAAGRCAQCHTPVCKECIIKKGGSIFCSETCVAANEQFKGTYKGPANLSKNYFHRIFQGIVYIVILILIVELLAYMKYDFFVNLAQKFPWYSWLHR